jgi:hypothetical protein
MLRHGLITLVILVGIAALFLAAFPLRRKGGVCNAAMLLLSGSG